MINNLRTWWTRKTSVAAIITAVVASRKRRQADKDIDHDVGCVNFGRSVNFADFLPSVQSVELDFDASVECGRDLMPVCIRACRRRRRFCLCCRVWSAVLLFVSLLLVVPATNAVSTGTRADGGSSDRRSVARSTHHGAAACFSFSVFDRLCG